MPVHVRPYARRHQSVPRYYKTLREQPALASAIRDFQLEERFARQYLAGRAKLSDFPYYKSYVSTIAAEAAFLREPKRILFIGSGPVPLSAILFARKFPRAQVDIMDVDPAALHTGATVARKAGTPLGRELSMDAATCPTYPEYDVVVMSLEAGPTETSKRAVLSNLFSCVGRDAIVLLRGSRDAGGETFVRTRELLPDNAAVLDTVTTFDGFGETIVTKRKP